MKGYFLIQKTMTLLVDEFHRKIDYLRIGVTDRCNLRCRYCMPAEGIDFSARKDILSYEEILRLVRVFADLGVCKVRLTGGEPFVRKDIGSLIERIAALVPDIRITTNATLLNKYLPLLKEVGVKGLNISIDSLDEDMFRIITRRDGFAVVKRNILACKEWGVPFKLNMVVMKGINDREIPAFLDFAKELETEVRFIEAMPFNEWDGNKGVFMPASEIETAVRRHLPSLEEIPTILGTSSLIYAAEGHPANIGVIPAYTRSLCGTCNRIRLTPKGEILTCLYASTGKNVLEILRGQTISDEDLKRLLRDIVWSKKKNGFVEEALQNKEVFRSMTTIGG
jgi:cyclic pyranopterin phosphate synthase